MFITFEGIDGSGKSTQAKKLSELLEKKGLTLLTREPGGWEGGALLRELVLKGKLEHRWSELFLFLLDRSEHCARVIEPALAQGKTVLCERYNDSTLAYQAWGRGLPLDTIDKITQAAHLPLPDITVLFKIEPAIALKRVTRRGIPDSFEKEGLAFMSKIEEGYEALAAREPERWLVLECGDKTEEELFSELLSALKARGLEL